MKSYIDKFFAGVALTSLLALGSCVGDLDQAPKDPNTAAADEFANNPKEYLGGVMAKCYSGIAVSGQGGPDGDSDISGLDGGTSQWSRAIFMLNEFTTDEVNWVWPDVGVFDLCTNTWGSSNANIFGAYSRFYTHIAICNDFIRLTRDLDSYGITVGGSGEGAISQEEVDQFVREARALRDLSYYYVIDFFGNAVVAWDDMQYGETPQQTTRAELFKKVTDDLEDVLKTWPDGQNVVYGRIGKDAVHGLLCKYYLNAEVFTGTAMWDKVKSHANAIFANHTGGFNGTGLANDYLALFCGNNDMFMPGGSLPDQNEILWGIPYNSEYTQPYGGTMFMIAAPVKDMGDDSNPGAGFMTSAWYGTNQNWACMHARQQFSEKFGFAGGSSSDGRTYLWVTDNAGFKISNTKFTEFTDGYPAIKFTNVMAESDGTLPKWKDPVTGLNRAGVQPVISTAKFPDTDLPIIRLADVYLMYAEAALRSGTDMKEGLDYVNYVRQRAGVSTWNTTEYNLNNLLDERARELYWENVRRTDLIRFNKYTSGYNWAWKGNVDNGVNIASYRVLFPIPADVIATYGSSYKQNLGY